MEGQKLLKLVNWKFKKQIHSLKKECSEKYASKKENKKNFLNKIVDSLAD